MWLLRYHSVATYAKKFLFGLLEIPTMKSNSTPRLSRRVMFAGVGTAGAAAALAAALPAVRPQAPVAEAPQPAPERGGGYQLSEHVQRYYKTTRI